MSRGQAYADAAAGRGGGGVPAAMPPAEWMSASADRERALVDFADRLAARARALVTGGGAGGERTALRGGGGRQSKRALFKEGD